ncbi:MAG: 4Fe-4S dicluster domain-containing protein [Candidatus Aminicenantales bacterium]
MSALPLRFFTPFPKRFSLRRGTPPDKSQLLAHIGSILTPFLLIFTCSDGPRGRQGGAGIGSYAYGWFLENVISARVVLTDGEIKEFTGKDLELISDAEGTTGIISQVAIQVMKREELGLTAIACPDAHRLTTVFQEFISRALPLWSVVFINPRMAEMKNRAADRDKVVSQLPDILHDCMGEILSPEIAEHEWANRFKLMVVKRLGPSLVPAEIVVPLESLGKVMEEIEHRINQPIVKEGVIIRTGRDGKPEAVILGFIPSDQRKFSYNFVFGLVLSIIKVAEKYGGRPYSTGLYFVRKAQKILGEDRALRLKAFQKKIDRKRILNPGKVVQLNLVSRALGIAKIFEPLVRPFGNIVVAQVGERIGAKPIRGIPADVAWYAYACSQCGYCVDECDQFYGRGWESQSPRGKWYWLREFLEGRAEWDQKMVDTLLNFCPV